jgi:hypothetical protein
MELYTGLIPSWLTEEDRKSFTAKRLRKVLAESESEGRKGFSGRDSIKIFNEFYSTHAKESLYYYNEERISRNIQNYLFALNFEIGMEATSQFTGEKVEITEEYLQGIETHLLDGKVDAERRIVFRKETQKEYASKTLTQEVMVEGRAISETTLYELLHDRYVYHLKKSVLDPFLKNENFRRAIKDYGEEDFKAYNEKIRDDVTDMIHNLCEKPG